MSWPAAIERALHRHGWDLAIVEIGTRGSVAALLAEGLGDLLLRASILNEPPHVSGARFNLRALCASLRAESGADVALAVRARTRGNDMAVSVAVVQPAGSHVERRIAFLGGSMGRTRAGLLAAAVLHGRLR